MPNRLLLLLLSVIACSYAHVGGSVHANSDANVQPTVLLSSLTADEARRVVSSWNLEKLARCLYKEDVDGDTLLHARREDFVDTEEHCSQARPHHWSKFWRRLDALRNPTNDDSVEASSLPGHIMVRLPAVDPVGGDVKDFGEGPARRLSSKTTSTSRGSGVRIKHDAAALEMGPDADVSLVRTGYGAANFSGNLTIDGTLSLPGVPDVGAALRSLLMPEVDEDDCLSNPCGDGATCTDVGLNNFTCDCAAGYFGFLCDEDSDDCESAPCGNYGTCNDNGTLSYECTCEDGWSGAQCTLSTDATEYLCESEESFDIEVPDGATVASILLQGGDGGWSYESRDHQYATMAGYGGITEIEFDVQPGDLLTVFVGCNGEKGEDGEMYGGGGGGASAVLLNDNLMAVAGGGGGASGARDSNALGGYGGPGGGEEGGQGGSDYCAGGNGATGGTQSANGEGGDGNRNEPDGNAGDGVDGGDCGGDSGCVTVGGWGYGSGGCGCSRSGDAGGGGGGGGYYGGGGGGTGCHGTGGGGGSGYCDSNANSCDTYYNGDGYGYEAYAGFVTVAFG